MNDPWIVATMIFFVLAIVLFIGLVNRMAVVSKASKSEKIRQDFFMQNGMPVTAKVTRVALQKEHKQYIVFATWQSHETGRVYPFQETYMYPIGAHQGFQPKIGKGSTITVWVIFNQPTYYMEQNW